VAADTVDNDTHDTQKKLNTSVQCFGLTYDLDLAIMMWPMNKWVKTS